MHFCRVHPASGMVSEIRDADAARQVLQFIDTGHQVWTTIHVHSANAILFRLLDMGVGTAEVCKPGNIELLMKQTLLPRLCDGCALEAPAGGRAVPGRSPVPDWLNRHIGTWPLVRFRNPEGCATCNRENRSAVAGKAWNGYVRQIAIAEAIRPDAAYLAFVRQRDPGGAWEHWVTAMGGRPIGGRIWALVAAGKADPFDALRKGAQDRAGGVGRSAGGRRCRGRRPMNGLVQRLAAALVLGRKARVDVFRMIADLLEAGFSLERALGIAAQVAKDQGQRARAQLLLSWRRALLEDRFAETAADALPASEAMIFHAYGRVDAGVLFAAAARVAEMRDRQLSAVWKALAMPLVLAVGLVLLLWAAGGYFVPVIETVSPPEEWSTGARLFRSMSTWLHANTLLFGGMLAGLVALTAWAMVAWTGPGRTLLDRIAPFSLYRTITGSAFLFVVMEFLAAGIDVNDRAFEALKRSASPYVRHRIASIQGFMARGAGLGRSMVLAGHGFPDPSLVPVVAALDGAPGWEKKLARFVERWVGRSEELLRARAAALNGALLIVVAGVMGSGIDAMFSILELAAGR